MTNNTPELKACQWMRDLISGFPWDDSDNALKRSYACQEAGLLELIDTEEDSFDREEYGETMFILTEAGIQATAEPKILEVRGECDPTPKQLLIHHNMGERFTVLPEMHSKQPIVNDDALAEAIKYFKDDEYRETIDGSLDYLHFEERLDVIIYHASKNDAVEVTVDELLRDVGYRDNMFAEILTCIGQAYPEGVKIVDGGK